MGSLVVVVLGFVVFAVAFGIVERICPAIPGVSIFRRDRRTDYTYWFVSLIGHRAIDKVAAVMALVPPALLLGFRGKDLVPQMVGWFHARSPFAHHPPALALLEALLLSDFFAYWMHRCFHGKRLWRFHAVHHSGKMLDWLAASRGHPVNEVMQRLAVLTPIVLCGFDVKVLAAATPVLVFWALFIHANVPWGFGPLRYVITTPLFHRWHHTSEDEGLDKNFAGLFPIYDLVFGTFYAPPGKQPTRFGVAGDGVPPGYLAQLTYPFRRAKGPG
jgi:sterol desaturase/sphingolipid hydroxylase (fatty acid hydroxylase superfamily)